MPIEHLNISLSPQMARFIRGKVKTGDYADASEVVRDAVRRLRADETSRKDRALLVDSETMLTSSERQQIGRSVKSGLADLKAGRFVEYDAEGLRTLGKELVAGSVRKRASAAKAG